MKNPERKSLMPKRFEVSAGSSGRSNRELKVRTEILHDMTGSHPSPEIQAAQQLLARIAARIINRRKTDEEQRINKSDPRIDHT
jgi:hypothetical protein